MQNLPENKKIILFDGFCNLCDTSVQFIIKRDKKDVFRFVSLQSDLGKELIQYLGMDAKKTDSIILYEPSRAYYYKSKAIFEIIKSLGGFWQILLFFAIFPQSFTDKLYDFVAKNRYRWFGKKDNCMIPTQEILSKFLG